MESDPQVMDDTPAPYATSDKTSFASTSAQERWPVIITSAIDDVHRSTGSAKDDATQREGKEIVEQLAKLKYELQHNRQLTPILDDGQPDVDFYNNELQQLGNPTWHNVSWLFSECYLYRRIATSFSLSTKWKQYDIFSRQKLSTFKSSQPAVVELANRYTELISQLRQKTEQPKSVEGMEEAEKILFTEMCEICLWGNATDLSLLTNLSYEDIQKLQGSSARKAAEKNILVNDIPKAFEVLKRLREEKPNAERRIDIVLDNAGFELFVDLVLAGYLIAAGLATTIVLHPKSIPWFVSDVLPTDFSALLNALANPQSFFSDSPTDEGSHKSTALSQDEVSNVEYLFQDWSNLHAEGKLVIRPNRFWTHAGSFWRLPKVAPELFSDLRDSDLVIFKGDLNYRKLTGDVIWSPTTPFTEAIGPLSKSGNGLRVLSLRTCKADVVVGLPKGRDEELRDTDGGGGNTGARKWAWSGKWAVVQYSDGK